MSTYRVAIDVYEGPLDVLLRLIERRELDITRVSLALVADQYLAHIAVLRELSAANLADFLVIAARLLVIKSRHLLPREEEAEDDDEELVGEDLAQQLREYKRYKEAAAQLREVEEAGRRSYPRLAPSPHIERRPQPGEMSAEELLAAMQRAIAAHPPKPPVDEVVAPVVVHIADRVAAVREAIRRSPRVRFSTFLQQARSWLEVVVTFLAVLEMVKQQEVRAIQEHPFGEILLERRTPDPDADIPALDLSEYGEEAGAAEE